MNKPEVWLRGKVEGVPNLLQPAAHALLQSGEEVEKYLTGVVDRMLTYAQAEKLSENQFKYLKNEGKPDQEISVGFLVKNFQDKVNEAIDFLKNTPENILTENRAVGRKELPSTLIGLLFHAAEHSQRHVGQLLVTVSFLMENREI